MQTADQQQHNRPLTASMVRSHHPPADTQQPPRRPFLGHLPVALQRHGGSGSSRPGTGRASITQQQPNHRCSTIALLAESGAHVELCPDRSLPSPPPPPRADRCGSQKYPPSLLLHLPRRWRRAEPSAFVRIKAGVMSASIAPPARLIGGENAAAAPCRPRGAARGAPLCSRGEEQRKGSSPEAAARPVLTLELLRATTAPRLPRFCTDCVCSTERGTGRAEEERDGGRGKGSSRDKAPAFPEAGHQAARASPVRTPATPAPAAAPSPLPSPARSPPSARPRRAAPPRPAPGVTSREAAVFKSPSGRQRGWRCCGPSISCRSSTAPPYW